MNMELLSMLLHTLVWSISSSKEEGGQLWKEVKDLQEAELCKPSDK